MQSLEDRYINAGLRNPDLIEAALALAENRLHDAEPLLKRHLKADPFDVAAMRMLAELAGRIGRYRDQRILCDARWNWHRALQQRDPILLWYFIDRTASPMRRNLSDVLETMRLILHIRAMKAAALGRLGDYDEAIAL